MKGLMELLAEIFSVDVLSGLSEESVAKISDFEQLYTIKQELKPTLADGWRRENGSIDLDKVLDTDLRFVLEDLKSKLTLAEREKDIIKKTYEAKGVIFEYNVVDVDDVLKFIDLSRVGINDEGYAVGVRAQMNELKKNKPYLFKDSGVNHIGGFNPPLRQSSRLDIKSVGWVDAYNASRR